MNVNDIVYIDYIAKVKETGEIIDVTNEQIAKELGVYNPNIKYEALPVILGKGFIIKGLEEELLKMKEGEEKEIEIPPEKAFGKRDENLIKIFKEKDFDKNVEVGQYIRIGNFVGKVISKNSGRILIDFNHPLAGKTLIYKVKIVKKVENDKEKINAISKILFGKTFEIEENGNEIKIFENELLPEQRASFSNLIFETTNYKKAIFISKFEKK